MTEERWQEILGQVKDSFPIEEERKEHLEEQGGIDTEYVIFRGPLGRMKLEFTSKPVVLDKKTSFSRRIGTSAHVEYVYSEEEKTHKLHAYKWDDATQEWVEIEAKNFEF